MVAANAIIGIQFVRGEEGGNDDDPQDHGGRTSRGITQREWDAWRVAHPGTDLPADVWAAPNEQIDAIYKEQYWQPYCDRLPAGVDVEFFDFCVNAGRQQAVKILQRALDVTADGMMGIITWTAVEAADPQALITAFAERRRMFYRALAQFPRYGKGWLGRTDRCEKFAASLAPATTVPRPVPAPLPKASPKANPTDIKKPPIHPEGGVIGSGSLLAILSQFKEALEKLTGVPHIEYVLAGIAAAVFVVSLYGFWHRNKMQAQVG